MTARLGQPVEPVLTGPEVDVQNDKVVLVPIETFSGTSLFNRIVERDVCSRIAAAQEFAQQKPHMPLVVYDKNVLKIACLHFVLHRKTSNTVSRRPHSNGSYRPEMQGISQFRRSKPIVVLAVLGFKLFNGVLVLKGQPYIVQTSK